MSHLRMGSMRRHTHTYHNNNKSIRCTHSLHLMWCYFYTFQSRPNIPFSFSKRLSFRNKWKKNNVAKCVLSPTFESIPLNQHLIRFATFRRRGQRICKLKITSNDVTKYLLVVICVLDSVHFTLRNQKHTARTLRKVSISWKCFSKEFTLSSECVEKPYFLCTMFLLGHFCLSLSRGQHHRHIFLSLIHR